MHRTLATRAGLAALATACLGLPAVALAGGSSIHRCVLADGRVSFSDQGCPATSRQGGRYVPSANAPLGYGRLVPASTAADSPARSGLGAAGGLRKPA